VRGVHGVLVVAQVIKRVQDRAVAHLLQMADLTAQDHPVKQQPAL